MTVFSQIFREGQPLKKNSHDSLTTGIPGLNAEKNQSWQSLFRIRGLRLQRLQNIYIHKCDICITMRSSTIKACMTFLRQTFREGQTLKQTSHDILYSEFVAFWHGSGDVWHLDDEINMRSSNIEKKNSHDSLTAGIPGLSAENKQSWQSLFRIRGLLTRTFREGQTLKQNSHDSLTTGIPGLSAEKISHDSLYSEFGAFGCRGCRTFT